MFGDERQVVAELVHGYARVLSQKVSRVKNLAAIRVYQRIIVRTVGFDLDLPADHGDAVHRGTDKLRQTSQSIAVLYQHSRSLPTISPRLTSNNFRSVEQCRHGPCGPDLSGMRLNRLYKWREALICGKQGLRKQCVYAKRQRDKINGSVYRVGGYPRARSRAVIQRQTLLGFQFEWSQSESIKSL